MKLCTMALLKWSCRCGARVPCSAMMAALSTLPLSTATCRLDQFNHAKTARHKGLGEAVLMDMPINSGLLGPGLAQVLHQLAKYDSADHGEADVVTMRLACRPCRRCWAQAGTGKLRPGCHTS